MMNLLLGLLVAVLMILGGAVLLFFGLALQHKENVHPLHDEECEPFSDPDME